MSPRKRRLAWGMAAAFVVVGVLCAVLIAGHAGEIIGVTVMTLALGAIVLLIFLEIGLSEDRARAEEEAGRRERAAKTHSPPRARPPRRPT